MIFAWCTQQAEAAKQQRYKDKEKQDRELLDDDDDDDDDADDSWEIKLTGRAEGAVAYAYQRSAISTAAGASTDDDEEEGLVQPTMICMRYVHDTYTIRSSYTNDTCTYFNTTCMIHTYAGAGTGRPSELYERHRRRQRQRQRRRGGIREEGGGGTSQKTEGVRDTRMICAYINDTCMICAWYFNDTCTIRIRY